MVVLYEALYYNLNVITFVLNKKYFFCPVYLNNCTSISNMLCISYVNWLNLLWNTKQTLRILGVGIFKNFFAKFQRKSCQISTKKSRNFLGGNLTKNIPLYLIMLWEIYLFRDNPSCEGTHTLLFSFYDFNKKQRPKWLPGAVVKRIEDV